MQVTEVRVYPAKEGGARRALASAVIVLDNAIAIHGLAIIQGKDGPFLVFPDRKNRKGRFVDIAHPINNETRTMIVEAVMKEYENTLETTE